MRQHLLENSTLDLNVDFKQARVLEFDQITSEKYSTTNPTLSVAKLDQEQDVFAIVVTKESWKCYFCGSLKRHLRSNCPARDETCNKCGKVGRFVKVCNFHH